MPGLRARQGVRGRNLTLLVFPDSNARRLGLSDFPLGGWIPACARMTKARSDGGCKSVTRIPGASGDPQDRRSLQPTTERCP